MSQVRIEGISKQYQTEDGDVRALSPTTLTVSNGEFLVLVGPSGCGKTTLLNIVAGLLTSDSGEVWVGDERVTGPGPDRAVVFQDGALFPWLTVRQNVEFGLRQQQVPPRERADAARAMLDRLHLLAFENRSIHELSGGMRQRVAIARSLVLKPKVLLMDEPFSALDAITREDLYTDLQELWAEEAPTVIFVTHNVREAVVLGHRVVLMSARPGRIEAIYPIEILRPRRIEDTDVGTQAQEISHAMRDAMRRDLPLTGVPS